MADSLVKLHFPTKSCRAEVLHMDQAWQKIIQNQDLPECIEMMLGEMTAAAVMLAASLKFDGALVLQMQGDGPVRLALVEVRTGLLTRATAQLRVPRDQIKTDATFTELVNQNGNGRCAMILDMAGRAQGEQPYQGVVALKESVASTLENYMTQSEQVQTGIWLAADKTAAGGVLLQKVASTGGLETKVEIDPEGFDHLKVLAETVKSEELLTLDATEVARRLFWEDNPNVLETLTPAFKCRGARRGIELMVKSLGKDEAKSIIEERGDIEVRCEFCGTKYVLDAIDVAGLFDSNISAPSKTVN